VRCIVYDKFHLVRGGGRVQSGKVAPKLREGNLPFAVTVLNGEKGSLRDRITQKDRMEYLRQNSFPEVPWYVFSSFNEEPGHGVHGLRFGSVWQASWGASIAIELSASLQQPAVASLLPVIAES